MKITELFIRVAPFDNSERNPLFIVEKYHLGLDSLVAIAMQTPPQQPSPMMLTSGASGRVNALCSLRALKTLLKLVNLLVVFLLFPFRGRWRVAEKGGRVKVMKTVPGTGAGTHACGAVGTVDQEVAARRALAMKRVMEDKDDGKSVREFMLFVGGKGRTLFTQCWTPVNVQVRGLVIVLHGLNEHSGRYNDFAKRLNANGFKVYGMDWIGHGGSDGLHGYVHSLDDAVDDLKLYLDKVLSENPGLPCFFFGHSTGAAIMLKAALDPKIEARISGLVLTSPAVGVQPPLYVFVLIAPVIATLLPRYQLSAANKQGTVVSRDPDALIAKYSDPLVFTGSVRVRTGYEILRISSHLQQNLSRMRAPFLVLHGSDDRVTDPKASERLYVEASSTDKSLILCKGLLHDLLFEPEREAIMSDIIEWLNCRV